MVTNKFLFNNNNIKKISDAALLEQAGIDNGWVNR